MFITLTNAGQVQLWGFHEAPLPRDLGPCQAVSTGGSWWAAVIKEDGFIRAWPEGLTHPQVPNDVTVLNTLGPFKALDLGWNFGVALTVKGEVVGWGPGWPEPPPQMNMGACKAIVAGGLPEIYNESKGGAAAIDEFGQLFVWGDWYHSSPANPLHCPLPWKSFTGPFIAISAHGDNLVAIREDGTVFAFSESWFDACDPNVLKLAAPIPPPWPGVAVTGIAASGNWVIALSNDCDHDGTADDVQIAEDPSVDCNGNSTVDACDPLDPSEPSSWKGPAIGSFNESANWCLLPPTPASHVIFAQPGLHDVTFPSSRQVRSVAVESGPTRFLLNGKTFTQIFPSDPALSWTRVGAVESQSAALKLFGGTLKTPLLEVGAAENADASLMVGEGGILIGQGSIEIGHANGAHGTLRLADGGTMTTQSCTLGAGAGSIGVLEIGAGSQANTVLGTFVQSGVISLEAGSVLSSPLLGVVLYEDGALQGDGTLIGPLTNFGSGSCEGGRAGPECGGVSPGLAESDSAIGTLQVNGSYFQVPAVPKLGLGSGSLRIDVTSNDHGDVIADLLEVNGMASLGGGVFISVPMGFDPERLVNLPILTADSLDESRNRFDVAFTHALPGGRYIRVHGLAASVTGGKDGIALSAAVLPLLDFGGAEEETFALEPVAALVGDFKGDRDGRDDIAVAVKDAVGLGSLLILTNDGSGGFETEIQKVALGTDPSGLAAGRFRVDGPVDLAVVNRGSNTLQVLFNLNDGSGNFTLANEIDLAGLDEPGLAPSAVAAGGFLSAPDPLLPPGPDDLVVANAGSDNVIVFANNGFGLFAVSQTLVAEIDPSSVDPTNADPDRPPEIAVACQGSSTVLVWDRVDGAFGDPKVIPVGAEPVAVKSVDFDEDGYPDLVTTNAAGDSISVIVNRSLEDGTLSFSPAVNLPVGNDPLSLAFGDFDDDADQDLAVITDSADGTTRVIQVIRNDTDAGDDAQLALVLAESLDAGEGEPRIVLASTFDEDSMADIATVNAESGTTLAGAGTNGRVELRPAQTRVRSVAGDIDGDGFVNGADLTLLLGLWGPCLMPCSADLNDDGVVDGADITIVLGNWSPQQM